LYNSIEQLYDEKAGTVKVTTPQLLLSTYNVPQYFEILMIDNDWAVILADNILKMGYRPEYLLITGGSQHYTLEEGHGYKFIGNCGPTFAFFDKNKNRPPKNYSPYE
jgi:hypothetical protein